MIAPKLLSRVEEYRDQGYRISHTAADQVTMIKPGLVRLPLLGRWIGRRYRVTLLESRRGVVVEFR